jgi:ABC-type branched-subunit amino acid transport system permease subunit
METSRTHVVLTIAAVVALTLLTDPFMVLMPDMAQMIVLALATALICGWVGLIMLEKQGDEREVSHRMYAGRAAYLSGVSLLTIALVYQGLTHTVDFWIPVTLGVMLIAKLSARYLIDNSH